MRYHWHMRINLFTNVVGHRPAKVQPENLGLSWRYNWADMEPGEMFAIFDTDPATRTRMATGAASAGKRMGRRYSVGKLYDEEGRDPVHVGYYAIRVDGCEIKQREQTPYQKWVAAEAEERRLARHYKAQERLKRKVKIEPVQPLGTYAAGDSDDDYAVAMDPAAGVDAEALRAEWAAAPGFDAGEDAV